MSDFWLQYGSSQVRLPEGEFTIGRSSSCDFEVSDPLISRRHAVFRVAGDSVTVHDLHSRNGVYVNGERIRAGCELSHEDRVAIGGQELTLLDLREWPRHETTALGDNTRSRHDTERSEIPSLISESSIPSSPEESTQQATGFGLATILARKAVALGRYEDAQRLLEPHLIELLARARDGKAIDAARMSEATRFALRLAEGLGERRWVDWVFALHSATLSVPESEAIEALHGVVRGISYRNAESLRVYLETIGARRTALSAPERFLLQRIEGLERVVSA